MDVENASRLASYWSLTPAELLEELGSSAQGLPGERAQELLQSIGPNAPAVKRRATALGLFLNQFRNPLILILLFATGVSAATQDWVDALIILAIVLGSAVLGFFQEYSAGVAMEKLRVKVRVTALAVRDGEGRKVPAEEIVPGDVVLLSAGSLIPADGVLLEARDFYVNQAILTGETFPVEKRPGTAPAEASLVEKTNCVFMGTNVRSGSARVLIVQTGPRTSFGEIAKRITVRPPETDFERGVRQFGYLLSRIMLVLVVAVFAINVFFQRPVLDSLLFSLALAVGITPALLPAIISVTLSQGSKRMAEKGVIVRRLNAIENFGSMDVLCTDKTGTLTEGVVKLDAALDVQGHPSSEALRCAYLNASMQTGLSNPLDQAITALPKPDLGQVAKIDEIPYDFVRKRLSVVVEEDRSRLLMITKGAVDSILAACSQVRDGGDQPLDEGRAEALHRRFTEWSSQGFRVLGVAVREFLERRDFTRYDETDMTLVGFLLFFDPPKSDVQEAILSLESAGIELKIITGDNKQVSLHIAQAIGMKVSGVITGSELNQLADEALWHQVEKVNLFVEVDPNQKERIILALRKKGRVVGYMGDGINDAPSLHAADVGISVDQAVDVAKEAADFVLLEKGLDVLERAVRLGRAAFANTLKYVYVTTSANFGNMFSLAGASLFLPFLPLLPMQILLTNFLTDFPAFTIASDLVDPEMVARPRRWEIPHIRNFMLIFGTVSSVFDYLTFGLLLLVLHASTVEFRTGWFVESVMTELLVMLVIRTQRPFFRSRIGRMLLVSTAVVAGITLLLPYSPSALLLGFAPLSMDLVLGLLGITLWYLFATEATKRWFYRPQPAIRRRGEA
jgi:Mg2+-importing ATPase